MRNYKKINSFAEIAEKIFKDKYQNIVTDTSSNLYEQYEKECIEKAKELGMDVDELDYNGQCIGLKEAGLDYTTSKKTIWWEYIDEQIMFYSWI